VNVYILFEPLVVNAGEPVVEAAVLVDETITTPEPPFPPV
jgi:hypothetical protein